jgi:hypothetical protein
MTTPTVTEVDALADVVVTISITGAEPLQAASGGQPRRIREFTPDTLRIVYCQAVNHVGESNEDASDWEVVARVSGPRILKDGSRGHAQESRTYEVPSQAPAWIRVFIDQYHPANAS